jgi:hypothetical protein
MQLFLTTEGDDSCCSILRRFDINEPLYCILPFTYIQPEPAYQLSAIRAQHRADGTLALRKCKDDLLFLINKAFVIGVENNFEKEKKICIKWFLRSLFYKSTTSTYGNSVSKGEHVFCSLV